MFETKDIPPDYREDLSSDMKKVIQDWAYDSTPFNNALRYGKTHEFFKNNSSLFEKTTAKVELLVQAIHQSSLKQDYIVARGLGPYDIQRVKKSLYDRINTGISVLIQDEGFTAVSYLSDIAHKYAIPDDHGEKYLLVSKLHRGDQALFIGNENPSIKRKEGEILLKKKLVFILSGKEPLLLITTK